MIFKNKSLTFKESKQAITLPFSTWQLLGGWANLHSSSLREQVPLWNCLHTSRVSHFVSLIDAIFRAMSVAGCGNRVEALCLGFRKRLSSWFRVKTYNTTKSVQACNQKDLLQFCWWGLSLLFKRRRWANDNMFEMGPWDYTFEWSISMFQMQSSDKAEGTFLEGSSAGCTSVPKMSFVWVMISV